MLDQVIHEFDVNKQKQKCKFGHHNSFAVSSGLDIRAGSALRNQNAIPDKQKNKTITRDTSKLNSQIESNFIF